MVVGAGRLDAEPDGLGAADLDLVGRTAGPDDADALEPVDGVGQNPRYRAPPSIRSYQTDGICITEDATVDTCQPGHVKALLRRIHMRRQ